MPEDIIEIKNLTKKFYPPKNIKHIFINPFAKPEPLLAINGINLCIRKGELLVLVGPNGAGKTTLIKILSSLILPSEGRVTINGYDIVKDEMTVKKFIGLLAGEERSFYWRLTGRENLYFFSSLYNIYGRQAKKRVEELADLLHIEELDKRFQDYSGGIRQKFAIARSLLNNPLVLFMDEPTSNLDPLAAEEVRNLIKKELVEKRGKTVLFCTHNLNEAGALSDRIVIMDRGIIKACASIQDLKNNAALPGDAGPEDIFKYYVAK